MKNDETKNKNKQTATNMAVLLFFLAAGLITVGLWLVFRPLALIFGGLVFLWLSVSFVRVGTGDDR